MRTNLLRTLSPALTAAAAATLVACGGGGDGGSSSDTAAPPPAATTLSGQVVVNGPVRNAIVCLDLNGNSACDAAEPSATKTGADGRYQMTVDSAVTAEQIQRASLVAWMVPGSADDGRATVDAADPTRPNTQRAYALRQVPGKAGAINPLTTLVAAGVTAGMTEAQARANVVLQLGLGDESRIDDYQADAPSSGLGGDESARTAALVTASALENGATLVVGNPSSAEAAGLGPLRSLLYTGTGNFRYLDFEALPKPAGTNGLPLRDRRVAQTNGAPVASGTLYNQAFLTPQGWLRCDASTPIQAFRGTPSRSVFCNARSSYSYSVDSSVADQPMADVITQQQSSPANIFNAGASPSALISAVGAARFPAGSKVQFHTSANATRPIFINSLNTDGRPQAEATTLEQLIASKPSAAVNLANAAGTLTLGLGSGNLKNLRVAFTGTTDATKGSVQFYECDLNEAQTVASSCVATRAGTYAIETVFGSRVMRFTGHAPTVMNHTRLYVEVRASQQANSVVEGNWIYQARESKPGGHAENVSTSNRLNTEAWQGLKTQLGL